MVCSADTIMFSDVNFFSTPLPFFVYAEAKQQSATATTATSLLVCVKPQSFSLINW